MMLPAPYHPRLRETLIRIGRDARIAREFEVARLCIKKIRDLDFKTGRKWLH